MAFSTLDPKPSKIEHYTVKLSKSTTRRKRKPYLLPILMLLTVSLTIMLSSALVVPSRTLATRLISKQSVLSTALQKSTFSRRHLLASSSLTHAFRTTTPAAHTAFQRTSPRLLSFVKMSPTRFPQHYYLSSTTTALGATRSASSTTTSPRQQKQKQRPYKLVIVESPSKCKTIEKILQQYVQDNNLDHDFVVTSCYGHIRNLPKNNQELQRATRTTSTKKEKHTNDNKHNFPYDIVGINLENDYEPLYMMLPEKQALVKELQSLAKDAQQVLLATDPDREGEAIAWHLQQVLLPDDYQRLSFTEITPRAIVAAVTSPTALNHNLVQAQETRRILDRLAGFTVSPVLWKKITPGLSAGRVQSVGMALVVERERERLRFQPVEYWDMQGNFSNRDSIISSERDFLKATLISINGTSLVAGKQDLVDNVPSNDEHSSKSLPQPKPNKYLLTKAEAMHLADLMKDDSRTVWKVKSVQGRERFSYAPEPFKTSTLQQESNQRLGLSVDQTMRTAQQLYEAGWISYMRTDATFLSEDAQAATVQAVTQNYGPQYVYTAQNNTTNQRKRQHKSKKQSDKVAQEAHEAIRPAIQDNGNFAHPKDVQQMPEIAQKLYHLILGRTLASRMKPQKSNQTTVIVEGTRLNDDGTTTNTVVEFRATGNVVLEPGYTLAWNRGSDSNNDNELPELYEGQILTCHELDPQSHTTQPPPRYTEASLVKELEALGVGRPSTYAGIVKILRERAYVGSPTNSLEVGGRQSSPTTRKAASGAAITAQRASGGGDLFGARGPLVPSLSAFVVTSLLEKHCPTYVDPSFTAKMEENLDRIANANYGSDEEGEGDDDSDFEVDDETLLADVARQRVAYLNEFYAGDQGLAAQIKRIDDHVQAEEARRAVLPALNTTRGENDSDDESDIGLYIGPWGPYIQQKTANADEKPLNAPLPAGMATDLSTITRGTLKALIAAKEGNGTILGQHPEDGRNIRLKVGRFGAYLQWGEDEQKGTTTHSLPKQLSAMRNLQINHNNIGGDSDVMQDEMPSDDTSDSEEALGEDSSSYSLSGMLGITLEEAVGYCGLPRTVCTLQDKPIVAAIGPYGPYLKFNSSFMSLHPRDGDVLTIDEERAQQLVTENIINKKSKARGVLAELGEKDGSIVTIKSGRFGAYINWKKVNAKLPSEYVEEPDSMPLEEAWALIQEKASSTTSSGKGSKATKKSKNEIALPPAPKRPKSAYMYFCSEKRPEVSETVKNKSLGDITKKLAELWKDTSETDRKRFEDLAEAAKVEYAKEKAAWQDECKKLGTGSGKKRTTSTSQSAAARNGLPSPAAAPLPKRPKSAYLFFCEAKRPEVSKTMTKLGDVAKELARLWADTTDRSEYEALADADKARYEDKKAQYYSEPESLVAATKNGATANVNGVSTSKVKGVRTVAVNGKSSVKGNASKTRSKSVGTKTTLRAPSAYMIFCKETRHEIVDENGEKLPLGETTKRLAQRWKDCDAETRAKFEAMAAQEKEKLLVVQS